MEDFGVRFVLVFLGVIGFLWLLVICLQWFIDQIEYWREVPLSIILVITLLIVLITYLSFT
tara:strand:+ start:644 stop:826 length:183 start_codon:yes stop_codon:yes gene_type:complete